MKTTVYRGPTLDYLTVYPDDFAEGKSCPLIICLHGFGANKDDLSDLAPLLSSTGYLYVFPDAPLATVDDPASRAWYERGGNESPEAVRHALAALDGFIKEVLSRYQVSAGQVLLLGFSQGGAMALRYGLPRPDLFAGIAVLSGSLRRVEELLPDLPVERTQPVFIAHGEDDLMVPVEWSQRLFTFLEEHGYRPTYQTYPIGHQISPGLMADLRAWGKKVLPPCLPG